MGFYFTINSMSWESKGTPLFTDKALFLLGGRGMVAGPAFSSSFSRLLRWPGTSGLESTQLVEGFTAYC